MAGAAWYRYNTVTVTNGSINVVGVGTNFLSQVSVGDAFTKDGTKFYEIALVVDDTHLNLQTAYTGATESTTYGILRNFTTTTNAVLAAQLTALLASWQTREDQQRTWLAGALQAGYRIDGTPANPPTTDPLAGYYPMSDAVGVTRYIPCPALLNKNGVVYAGTSGGTANALTLTPPSAMISYTAGIPITFQAALSNTAAATVNVSGLGVKNILRQDGSALRVNDIMAGQSYYLVYNGTAYNLIGSTGDTLMGMSTTATAGGTTVLTATSSYNQYFTGTLAQTVTLPVTSTLVAGQTFRFVNNSTGLVTVNSSGGNAVCTVPAGTSAIVTCILITGTTAASWAASSICPVGGPGAGQPFVTGALTASGMSTASGIISGTTTRIYETAYAQRNDNNTYALDGIAYAYGKLRIVDVGGTSYVPFYAAGGAGVLYKWNFCTSGGWQLATQGAFAHTTANGNTYQITFGGGNGILSVQRTGGSSAYTCTVLFD